MPNQWEIIEWRGCYPSNWKGVVSPDAMSHPAKFSSKLIRRIYDHMIEENWVKAGDCVIDPFGGVALGAFDAMGHGLNWTGIELEERFHKIGNANLLDWNTKYGAMRNWGTASLLNGDSRFLLKLIADSVSVVSSPPYAESIKTSKRGSGIDYSKAVNGGKGTAGRESIAMGYGETSGQLGHMKASEISYQLAISSPPFLQSEGGTPEPKVGGVIDAAMYERHAAGNKKANGYGHTTGQLHHMQDGNFELAVSSPPYEATTITENRQFRSAAEPGRPNASNLRNNGGNAYGAADGQLGNEIGDDFWLSARAIVEQVYESLAPGGHACWVVKDYVKAKQIVPFSDQWRQLCEAVGFETLHEHRAMLVHHKGTQGMLEGGTKEIKTESKSFFRRLAEKKGSPRIDWEVVWCMQKPQGVGCE